MDNFLIKEKTLTDIADVIRKKINNNDKIELKDMATYIDSISGDEETAVSVDLSQYDNGIITETYADGSTKVSNLEFDESGNVSKITANGISTLYTYEFDEDDRITKIIDGNGNSIVLTW